MVRSSWATRIIALLSTVAALGACGGDATSPAKRLLTQQEAQAVAVALLEEVTRALDSTTFASAPSGASFSRAPMPTETITLACARGGTIKATVTATDNTNSAGTGTVSGAVNLRPQQCGVSTGTRTIAVDGDLTFAFTFAFKDFEIASDFVMTAKGYLSWSDGTCPMDYRVTLPFSGSGTGQVTGTVCGESVNATL